MKLEPEQQSMLEKGGAEALTLKTLVAYGDAFGAKRLVPVHSAHLAGSFGILAFSTYLKILDQLVAEGARVKVKTTLNPRPGYEQNLINRITFKNQKRLEKNLEAVGVTPNFSCVCYEGANVPGPGDRLGWAESSAVQYANSVLGARTNRNSLVIDLCSAVTGLTPEFGYLLDENRRGRLLVKLAIDHMDPSALGFIIGKRAVGWVPVLEHHDFSKVDLKNLGGSMASSGAVALFHVEGVTPEAPDMQAVFDGEPEETITITQKDLDELRFERPLEANMVVFGCPQMTLDEALELAPHFEGKRVRRPTWFCMVPAAREKFEATPQHDAVRAAGVEINCWCPLAALSVRLGRKTVLTNSGKLYYYLAGAEYGNREDCLRASGVMA
jgi:predicted aconitase